MDLLSERLLYKRITVEDCDDYLKWYGNEETMLYITGKKLSETEALARFRRALEVNVKSPDVGFYSVKIRESGIFIGIAKLTYLEAHRAEVGYGSLPAFWGKRYASEMLETLILRAQKIPEIKVLVGVVNEHNIGSRKVLLNKGFTLHERHLEENAFIEHYHLKLP